MTSEFRPEQYPNLAQLQAKLKAPLVFLDIETTGLDPFYDVVIQIYAVDIRTGAEFHTSNLTATETRKFNGDYNNDAGLAMHYKSGLIDPYKRFANEPGHDVVRDEYGLLKGFSAWLHGRATEGRGLCVIGGRNVGTFDIPMLRKRMGHKATVGVLPISHRVFDVTMVSMVDKLLDTEDTDHVPPHTAKEDTLHDIRLAERFLAKQWLTKPTQTALPLVDRETPREDIGY